MGSGGRGDGLAGEVEVEVEAVGGGELACTDRSLSKNGETINFLPITHTSYPLP